MTGEESDRRFVLNPSPDETVSFCDSDSLVVIVEK